mmetsp:Transcript_20293/g.68893  ORF Transcript_20293/g.68893 Transcript_20293/m.68893 type:complete len:240 (+) Transcript_20293:1455-2174(+)
MRGAGDFITRSQSSLVSAKWPRWFVPNCRSNPSAVSWRSGRAMTPALSMSTSTLGTLLLSSLAHARTLSRLVRSSLTNPTLSLPERCLMASTAARPLVSLRHAIITSLPSMASFTADSSPRPVFPPVMSVVLPASETSSRKTGPSMYSFPPTSAAATPPPMTRRRRLSMPPESPAARPSRANVRTTTAVGDRISQAGRGQRRCGGGGESGELAGYRQRRRGRLCGTTAAAKPVAAAAGG